MEVWLEIVIRSLSLVFLVLVVSRILGKRNISRMTPFNTISIYVIAIISALISVRVIQSYIFGIIALGVWFAMIIIIENFASKSKWLYDWYRGKETVLVKHGKILDENLSQVRFTPEDLLRELRYKNAFNLADVEFAVLEVTGDLNVFFKSDKKPVTAYDLGIKVAPKAEPQTVILDGNILNESLASLGINQSWLKIQLENIGVNVENIFIAQVDSSGDIYLDLYDDAIQLPQPKVKEILYANLEKCQADLMTYALETKNENAKNMYSKNAKKLENILNKLNPYLLR